MSIRRLEKDFLLDEQDHSIPYDRVLKAQLEEAAVGTNIMEEEVSPTVMKNICFQSFCIQNRQ